MSETEEKVKLLQTVKEKKNLLGDWRLVYKLTNRMGPGGFTVRTIDSYTDPLTGAPRHLYNENGIQLPGYMIEKQTTILTPRTNRQHAHIVDFLLGHPKVFTERAHADLDEKYMNAKVSNPRITLTNLDYQDVSDVIDDDFIDKLVGRIVLDAGPLAIGIEKLRFILAKLNLKYREDKYLIDNNAEKPKLRKRLKDYVRQSKEKAQEVISIIDNIQLAQYEYELKEMIRTGLVTNQGGVHRYKDVSIGITVESVSEYFSNNVDFYSELASELYKKLKAENK